MTCELSTIVRWLCLNIGKNSRFSQQKQQWAFFGKVAFPFIFYTIIKRTKWLHLFGIPIFCHDRRTVTALIQAQFVGMSFFKNNNIFMANEQDDELKLALASSHLLFYTIRNQLKQISLLSISATAKTWPTTDTHKNLPKFKVSVSISNRNKQFSKLFALFYSHFMLIHLTLFKIFTLI